jgi:glycosyltransferase involved in cell wall biosynthesis
MAQALIDFSVIIPTHNRETYLAEAIASAHAQQGVTIEVLVINDGDPLHNAPTQVRMFDNQKRGAVAARNLGIAEARGTYIAFLDDDDYWTDPHHLQRARDALQSVCELYFSDGTLRYVDGRPDRNFAENADAESLRHNNTILMSTVCYARALHETLGNFDPELPYYYDWDWYLRLTCAGSRLSRHAESSVAIRVHPDSESARANQNARHHNLEKLCKKHGLGKLPLKNHADFAS